MRTTNFMGAILVASSFTSLAGEVELTWNRSASPHVIGYEIFYGGKYYTNSVFSSSNSVVVSKLTEGTTYQFTAEAVSFNGYHSSFSDKVYYTIPFSAPTLSISILTYKTNWFTTPLIETNKYGRVYTNQFYLSPKTFKVMSDSPVYLTWVIQKSDNGHSDWVDYKTGFNNLPAVVSVVITNTGGNEFFRMRLD